jgi:hypothetical protein
MGRQWNRGCGEERGDNEDTRMNYDEEYALKQHEARCNTYRDSNKATMEFSKMALRGAFVLNGAAAIAIIYSKSLQMYTALTFFATGALLAAISSGLTYVVQCLITLTWHNDLYKNTTDADVEAFRVGRVAIKRRGIFGLQCFVVFLVFASYVVFVIGLYQSHNHLKEQAQSKKPEQQEVLEPINIPKNSKIQDWTICF